MSNQKIKVFRFRVSNWSSAPSHLDLGKRDYEDAQNSLCTTDAIEDTLNRFLDGKSNIVINVNNIDVGYHNNARGNTIDLVYTILYNDN